MANLDKIKVGETTYDIQDSTARTSVAGKQEKLVSGTNLKTVNGTSLLGSGNLNVCPRFYKHDIKTQMIQEGFPANTTYISPIDTTWGECMCCDVVVVSTRSTPYTSFAQLQSYQSLNNGEIILGADEGELDYDANDDETFIVCGILGSSFLGYKAGYPGEITTFGHLAELPPIDGASIIDTVTPL